MDFIKEYAIIISKIKNLKYLLDLDYYKNLNNKLISYNINLFDFINKDNNSIYKNLKLDNDILNSYNKQLFIYRLLLTFKYDIYFIFKNIYYLIDKNIFSENIIKLLVNIYDIDKYNNIDYYDDFSDFFKLIDIIKLKANIIKDLKINSIKTNEYDKYYNLAENMYNLLSFDNNKINIINKINYNKSYLLFFLNNNDRNNDHKIINYDNFYKFYLNNISSLIYFQENILNHYNGKLEQLINTKLYTINELEDIIKYSLRDILSLFILCDFDNNNYNNINYNINNRLYNDYSMLEYYKNNDNLKQKINNVINGYELFKSLKSYNIDIIQYVVIDRYFLNDHIYGPIQDLNITNNLINFLYIVLKIRFIHCFIYKDDIISIIKTNILFKDDLFLKILNKYNINNYNKIDINDLLESYNYFKRCNMTGETIANVEKYIKFIKNIL